MPPEVYGEYLRYTLYFIFGLGILFIIFRRER
jgi:hypothetical protein